MSIKSAILYISFFTLKKGIVSQKNVFVDSIHAHVAIILSVKTADSLFGWKVLHMTDV